MMLLETDSILCELHESGLLLVTDKTGLIQAPMMTGPAGSASGDSIKAQMFLPHFEIDAIPFRQQVIFWLTRRPVSLGYAPNTPFGGDSLVYTGRPLVVSLSTTTGDDRDVQFLVNDDGRLSGIAFQLRESSGLAAENKAYRLLGLVLSHIAYEKRVPLYFDRVEVVDLLTSPFTYYVTLNKPFRQEEWSFSPGDFAPQVLLNLAAWRRALAFYRESLLLTHLPMYRFLALYKGIDDLKMVKAELGKVARRQGNKVAFPKDTLPADQHFSAIFPDLAGQPLSAGDRALEVHYRNLVAHNVLHAGEYLTSDLREGIVQYNNRCKLADVVFRLTYESIRVAAQSL